MLRRSFARFARAGVLQQRLTTLDNGARVVTFDELSPISCVGLFTMIGPRFETQETAGYSSLLESLAAVENMKYSAADLQGFLYRYEAGFGVESVRELMMHRVDCLRWEVEDALKMLLSMIFHIDLSEGAMAMHGEVLANQMMQMKSDQTKILFELLHRAAWGGKGLGRAIWIDEDGEAIDRLNAASFYKFLHSLIHPERVLVVCRGVEHEYAVDMVDRQLKEAFQGWELLPLPDTVNEPSVYTGGSCLVKNLEAPPTREKFEEKNNTQAGLVCLGSSAGDIRDYCTKLTAQALLGGGLAFSSGGPGKGMQTKLYREALCNYRWLDAIECITASYTDTGVFGIYGHAAHEQHNVLLQLMAQQLATVPQRVDQKMMVTGRNQLKSQLFMAIEERSTSVADIGRALLLGGKTYDSEALKANIDSTNLSDIADFMDKRLQQPLTMAVYGNTEGLHSIDDLTEMCRFHRRG